MATRMFLLAIAAPLFATAFVSRPSLDVVSHQAQSLSVPLYARRPQTPEPIPSSNKSPLTNLDDSQSLPILFSVIFIPVFAQAVSKGQFSQFTSDPIIAVKAFGPWFAINAALNLATASRRASEDAGNK